LLEEWYCNSPLFKKNKGMKRIFLTPVFTLAFLILGIAQNVGIGITSPTAQLHTTGSVRHAILNGDGIRPVFADANGNLLVTMPALPPSSVTNNNAQSIPDISCTGVSSINNLSALPVTVQSSSIMVTVNVTHTRVADLSIYLTAPGGAIINLLAPSAALPGANLTQTVFTDAGVLLSSGTAPYTGQFKPLANMEPSICGIAPTAGTFAAIGAGSINPNGAWSLKVIDNTASNTGTLNSWSISVVSGLGVEGVWGLKGNSGTNVFNFMGTTDNKPLLFRVNNIASGIIEHATYNTMFGIATVNANLKGMHNTGFGGVALTSNTTGESNTATGSNALALNETGSYNTATGRSSLVNNTTGSYNTAIGRFALFFNSAGNKNTAIGSNALFYSQKSEIVAVGESALINNDGDFNTAVGTRSLYANDLGSNNTAHGFQALTANVSGNYNTAVGTSALSSNNGGNGNTTIGSYSLLNNISGNYNTANGADALHNNSTGNNNTALGNGASYNTNASNNTSVGRLALVNNISGSSNTAVGTNALSNVSSGSSNTAIGAGADIFNGAFFNATAIGAGAIGPSSNSIQLGNASVANIYTNNNANMWVGELFVKGNGIVRNTSSLQLKMSSGSYVVSGNIGALSTIQIPFSFSQTFSTLPVVYIGNITGGPGGFAELIMSIANVTTTNATLFVSNPRTSAAAPNFTVNIVAIGGE
jgi:subtilisin-like proprotein convertase family protein